MQRALILTMLVLTSCGEQISDNHFVNSGDAETTVETPVLTEARPVIIGELGPSFAACNGAGTTRHLDPEKGETLLVRAAPFDTAEQTGAIIAGTRFFICTRSHDQRWMGVVWHESGTLAPECGVSSPVTTRRNYNGPCRSGWAPSAFIKLIAG